MKNKIRKRVIAIGLLALLLSACAVVTKDSCEVTETSPEQVQQVMRVGAALEKWLNDSGESVVIVSRMGQDLTQYGIEFSHMAYAVKEPNGWMIYHLLNTCPSTEGKLYKEGIGNFLNTATLNFRIAVMIPNPDIQQRLKPLIIDKSSRDSVFNSRYNAIAYPFALENQNSNGWILELFSKAVAQTPIKHRQDALQWLKTQNYQGSVIKAGGFKQMMATATRANISLTGHPSAEKSRNNIRFHSADSVMKFIAQYAKDPQYCSVRSKTIDHKVCVIN